jgi:hypothetical protein
MVKIATFGKPQKVTCYFKNKNMRTPIFNVIEPKTELQIDIRNLIHEQLETSKIQSKTSDNQYKISIFLTITAIFISLVPIASEFLIKKPNYNETIIRLTESQSKLNEKVSNMSKILLYLQNQVRTLEKENELLKQKNN